MALGLVELGVILGGTYFVGKEVVKSRKAKKKKKKNGNGGNGNGEAPPDETTEPVIVWGDPENCSDWMLTDGWIVKVARPIFYEIVSQHDAPLVAEDENGPYFTIDPLLVVHAILDDSVPSTCPIPKPEVDFTELQTSAEGQPNYFPNEAVLGLYWHVLEAVEYALTQIAETGDGVLFPLDAEGE